MDTTLKEELARSMFRFRKVGVVFPPGLDVHMGELVVMKIIAENVSESENKICISDIQNSLYITKPAVSQLLNSLERKGCVSREIDINDRRKFVIKLTQKGRKIMTVMKGHADKTFTEIITRFGEENTKQLITLFNQFADIAENVRKEVLQKGTIRS